MEAQTALVGSKGRVELDPVPAVNLELARVILPDDAELDDALGDGADLEGGAELGSLLEKAAVLEGADQLCPIFLFVSLLIYKSTVGSLFFYLCRPARIRARRVGWTLSGNARWCSR